MLKILKNMQGRTSAKIVFGKMRIYYKGKNFKAFMESTDNKKGLIWDLFYTI